MKSWKRLLLVVVLALLAIAFFVWSGIYNVAADERHWSMTARLMATLRSRSIHVRAAEITVPPLDDAALVRSGAGNYDAMCPDCHLKPGVEGTELRTGLYPQPPDLTRARRSDPAADFWVVKHGIKMSGMPAWGRSMEDQYVWGMVAFLQRLPDLTPDDYSQLVAQSGGHSHRGGETGGHAHTEGTNAAHSLDEDASEAVHDHGENAGPHDAATSKESSVHRHADGSLHNHETGGKDNASTTDTGATPPIRDKHGDHGH